MQLVNELPKCCQTRNAIQFLVKLSKPTIFPANFLSKRYIFGSARPCITCMYFYQLFPRLHALKFLGSHYWNGGNGAMRRMRVRPLTSSPLTCGGRGEPQERAAAAPPDLSGRKVIHDTSGMCTLNPWRTRRRLVRERQSGNCSITLRSTWLIFSFLTLFVIKPFEATFSDVMFWPDRACGFTRGTLPLAEKLNSTQITGR